MAFSEKTVHMAWEDAAGRCECTKFTHTHNYNRCNADIVWENRSREGRGCWEAYSIHNNGPDILSNCEIICWECHRLNLKEKKSFKKQNK